MKKVIRLILACVLCMGIFTGCGQKKEVDPNYEKFAGLYTCLGYYIEDQFVVHKDMTAWSVTLKKDGTGSVYWGEDINGAISEWSMEGEKIVIQIGDSSVDGTIADSIMLLNFDRGIILGWAGPGTDFDKLNMTTMELFLEQEKQSVEEASSEETELAETAGTYFPFAKVRDGYYIAMPEGLENGRFILNEDGTAQSPSGETVKEYVWSREGEKISFIDKDGELKYSGTMANGILTIDIIYTNPDGTSFTTQDILVKKDADTSAIETISIEEYNALPREQKNG